MPIFIVRVFDGSGSGWVSDVVTGMYECDDADTNVVNMSLGSGYSSSYQTAINAILAGRDDILFVAAAGNDGDSSYNYPASISEFVSVGSVTSSKVRSYFSQYNDEVDLVGPGSSVYSTTPGDNYAYYSGTSMATPHVVGVAALVWSHFPTLTAAAVRSALIASAEDLGPNGRDDEYGHGLVDAQEAMTFLTPATASPTVTCTDSEVPMVVAAESTGRESTILCDLVADYPNSCLCQDIRVKTHCLTSCGTCPDYKCTDSKAPFLHPTGGYIMNCEVLAALDPITISGYCDTFENLPMTCRATCGVCA